jgi:hypothetical protein
VIHLRLFKGVSGNLRELLDESILAFVEDPDMIGAY